jgi:hypothetical protein
LRDPRALTQHGNPVAHLDRLVDVVGDEDDRLAQLRLEAQELVLESLAVDGVHRAEGLVHQHHGRVRGERPGNPDPLLLAARELRRVAARELGIQPDQVQELGGPALAALPIPSQEPRDGAHVLGDGAVGEQADLLDHVADLSPQLGGRALADGQIADQDVALRDLDHAVDHPHRGRLAAARRPDEHADLPRLDLEGEVVHRGALGAPVALRGVPE